MNENHLVLLGGSVPQLTEGEVHVWCLPLMLSQKEQTYCLSLLSHDEKVRADKFYFENARQEFIAGRGMLRILLGRYLQMEPACIEFMYKSGRPVLDQQLQFNVSHSGGMGVFILGRCCVGIDVERLRPLTDLDDFAQRFFTDHEIATIRSLTGQSKQSNFFKMWACKEAYLKALGIGLLSDLNQIEILMDSHGTQLDAWQLGIFEPSDGYQAALAVEDLKTRIVFQPMERKNHPTIERVGYRLVVNH